MQGHLSLGQMGKDHGPKFVKSTNGRVRLHAVVGRKVHRAPGRLVIVPRCGKKSMLGYRKKMTLARIRIGCLISSLGCAYHQWLGSGGSFRPTPKRPMSVVTCGGNALTLPQLPSNARACKAFMPVHNSVLWKRCIPGETRLWSQECITSCPSFKYERETTPE